MDSCDNDILFKVITYELLIIKQIMLEICIMLILIFEIHHNQYCENRKNITLVWNIVDVIQNYEMEDL